MQTTSTRHGRLTSRGLTEGGVAQAAQTAVEAGATSFEHDGRSFAVGPNETNRASYHVDLIDGSGGRLRMLSLVSDLPTWPRAVKSAKVFTTPSWVLRTQPIE